jgi:hypothetical protein
MWLFFMLRPALFPNSCLQKPIGRSEHRTPAPPAGTPKRLRQASVAPLAAYQKTPQALGRTHAPVVAAVVDTLSVPVPAKRR